MMCMMETEHAEGLMDYTAWKKSPVNINTVCTHSKKQYTDKRLLGNYTLTDILWQDPDVVFAYVRLMLKCVLKPINDI